MRNAADQGDVSAGAEAAAVGIGRNERRLPEIIEFSCPYGHISHGRDALERVCEQKKNKYADLANELKSLRHEEVRVTAVIVSSMGAVSGPSLKDLQKILKCNDGQIRKLGRKMSETLIVNSMEIWRENAHEIEVGTNEEVNEMIGDEVENLDRAAAELEMGVNAEVELDFEAGAEAEEHEEGDLGEDEDDVDDFSAEYGQGEFDIGNGIRMGIGAGADGRIGGGIVSEMEAREEVVEPEPLPEPEEGEGETGRELQQGVEIEAEFELQVEVEPEEGQRMPGVEVEGEGGVEVEDRITVGEAIWTWIREWN
jgi:hypothetical protein